MYESLRKAIFEVDTEKDFETLALEVYRYQYKRNMLYQEFAQQVKKTPDKVMKLQDIPFLPIQFFKTFPVLCEGREITHEFRSSGTTGKNSSVHYITDIELYEKSFSTHFKKKFPNHKNKAIIALLPSYLEQGHSSLLYMLNHLITENSISCSGFYKELPDEIIQVLEDPNQACILFGVSYALLELAEQKHSLSNVVVMDTGGMKGKRKEIIRKELHEIVRQGLDIQQVYSEYGMTELLSQAYLTKDTFETPNWMKVLVRETTDPLCVKKEGKGVGNIIDLANIGSCAFIATDDLVEVSSDGSFDVLGRLDNAQVRGCNLLVQ